MEDPYISAMPIYLREKDKHAYLCLHTPFILWRLEKWVLFGPIFRRPLSDSDLGNEAAEKFKFRENLMTPPSKLSEEDRRANRQCPLQRASV